jgi:hypothetical protein
MGTKTTSNKCQQYLNNKRRINNKQRQLDKKLATLQKARNNPQGDNLINPTTKEEPKRKSLENIIKSCRIGRIKEGFVKETFKFKEKKIKEKK